MSLESSARFGMYWDQIVELITGGSDARFGAVVCLRKWLASKLDARLRCHLGEVYSARPAGAGRWGECLWVCAAAPLPRTDLIALHSTQNKRRGRVPRRAFD